MTCAEPPLIDVLAPSKLVDWMIKFQFDGDVDYFEVDPVAYGPALGDVGMKTYRADLEAGRATLGPEPPGLTARFPIVTIVGCCRGTIDRPADSV